MCAVYEAGPTGNGLYRRAAGEGLDVRKAFRELYPDDSVAVQALRGLPRGTILETTGDPYSWNGRFATK